MAKYTEEQLVGLKEEAYVPQPTILDAFNKMIEEVQQQTLAQYQEYQQQQQQYQLKKKSNGDTYIDEHGIERSYHNRRRGSRSGGNKPNLRKKNEIQVDEDGWATTIQPSSKSSNEEETFTKSNVGFKARPNNKNLGSSKAVDPREIVSDKQTKAFNAFAALGGSDDEEDDDDE